MPEQVLQQAEEFGLEGSDNSALSGGVEDARSAENSFVANVTGKDDNPKSKKRGKKGGFKGGLKKKGPLIAILIALVAGAVAILVAQGIMPFAVVNRLIEEYNTNGISSVLRADNVLDFQISVAPHTPLGFADHQLNALKDNNIYPLAYGGGTLLAYRKSNGSWKIVKGTTPENPDLNTVSSRYRSTYSGVSFGSMSFIPLKDAYNDADFKTPYTTASKTWRGGNSGWYDELVSLAETVHGFQRSRWFYYDVQKASKAVTSGVKSLFKSIAKARIDDAAKQVGDVTLDTAEDGTKSVVNETSNLQKGINIAQKFMSAASTAGETICAAVEGFIGVQTVISAYQRLQKINLAAGFMEAVQSVQAGGSSGEPMHEYTNNLTAVDPTTNKSAMNAAGMGSLFNGTEISTNDDSVKSVNTENALQAVSQSSDSGIMELFKDAIGNAKNLLTAFKTCNYVKIGIAVVDMIVTVVSVIPFIGQGIKAIQLSIKAVAKAAVTAIIKTAAPIVAKELIKHMGRKVLQDMATEWVGPNLGNALPAGGNNLLSSNHQTGGGSPGSPSKFAAFRREQERVIAEEAEYQRSIRSPFDITSGHTFLGSIVYSLIPLANSSGVGSVIKNVSSVMTNSVSKLLPTASAIAETSMVGVAKYGDCPIIQNMEVGDGVVEMQADAYCNPLYITDQDTIGSSLSMQSVIDREESAGNIDVNDCTGEITVKDDSPLADYIMFCGQRTSSWGLADANIASAIKDKSPLKALRGVPLLSDVADIGDAATSLTNLPWTTGAACVASENNSKWGDNKYHQRFIEDQRLLSDEGVVTNNPVAVYLEKYYEENPLDNSFEGILARYSGMTKDDVIATLELMEGLDYIADYKPEERYAFGYEEYEVDLQMEQTESDSIIAIEPKYIVYNTLRNRAVLV